MDPLHTLPNSIAISLLQSLDIRTIIACEQVCSFWHSFVSKPTIWKKVQITGLEELPTKWETIKSMLQLPKFSLQSFVDLNYLCKAKKANSNESIDPGDVIKFITSGSILHHLTYLNITRCPFLTSDHILHIHLSPFLLSWFFLKNLRYYTVTLVHSSEIIGTMRVLSTKNS